MVSSDLYAITLLLKFWFVTYINACIGGGLDGNVVKSLKEQLTAAEDYIKKTEAACASMHGGRSSALAGIASDKNCIDTAKMILDEISVKTLKEAIQTAIKIKTEASLEISLAGSIPQEDPDIIEVPLLLQSGNNSILLSEGAVSLLQDYLSGQSKLSLSKTLQIFQTIN